MNLCCTNLNVCREINHISLAVLELTYLCLNDDLYSLTPQIRYENMSGYVISSWSSGFLLHGRISYGSTFPMHAIFCKYRCFASGRNRSLYSPFSFELLLSIFLVVVPTQCVCFDLWTQKMAPRSHNTLRRDVNWKAL